MVSDDDDDSIKMTPSGPILSTASAIILPMKSSFPAEIEATAEIGQTRNVCGNILSEKKKSVENRGQREGCCVRLSEASLDPTIVHMTCI